MTSFFYNKVFRVLTIQKSGIKKFGTVLYLHSDTQLPPPPVKDLSATYQNSTNPADWALLAWGARGVRSILAGPRTRRATPRCS